MQAMSEALEHRIEHLVFHLIGADQNLRALTVLNFDREGIRQLAPECREIYQNLRTRQLRRT